MRIGVVFSQADSGTDPDAIRTWAMVAEGAGFSHLMAYDHVLGSDPALYPDGVGNFPAPPYTHEHVFHEIFVLFSHLAAVTTSLELVTSVLVLPQRQTALVAKQAATLDLLSGRAIAPGGRRRAGTGPSTRGSGPTSPPGRIGWRSSSPSCAASGRSRW